jgi:Ca2+/Na+ antiporter
MKRIIMYIYYHAYTVGEKDKELGKLNGTLVITLLLFTLSFGILNFIPSNILGKNTLLTLIIVCLYAYFIYTLTKRYVNNEQFIKTTLEQYSKENRSERILGRFIVFILMIGSCVIGFLLAFA